MVSKLSGDGEQNPHTSAGVRKYRNWGTAGALSGHCGGADGGHQHPRGCASEKGHQIESLWLGGSGKVSSESGCLEGRLPKVAKPVLPDATESTLQYNTIVLCNTIKTGATQFLRQQWPPAKQAMPAAQGPKPQCQIQTPDPHPPLAWAISFT